MSKPCRSGRCELALNTHLATLPLHLPCLPSFLIVRHVICRGGTPVSVSVPAVWARADCCVGRERTQHKRPTHPGQHRRLSPLVGSAALEQASELTDTLPTLSLCVLSGAARVCVLCAVSRAVSAASSGGVLGQRAARGRQHPGSRLHARRRRRRRDRRQTAHKGKIRSTAEARPGRGTSTSTDSIISFGGLLSSSSPPRVPRVQANFGSYVRLLDSYGVVPDEDRQNLARTGARDPAKRREEKIRHYRWEKDVREKLEVRPPSPSAHPQD